MRKIILLYLLVIIGCDIYPETIEKIYRFDHYTISETRGFHKISFSNTRNMALPGDPSLPWMAVSLMLPPGSVITKTEIIREEPLRIAGKVTLWPGQPVLPVSSPDTGWTGPNPAIYDMTSAWPTEYSSDATRQLLHGFGFAFASFTPAEYRPAAGELTIYRKVTIRIHTRPVESGQSGSATAIRANPLTSGLVKLLAQNPEMTDRYHVSNLPISTYDYLVVCPGAFKEEFQPLSGLMAAKGLSMRVVTTDSILAVSSGSDNVAKIRNFIINQYNNYQIQHVLLAGNPSLVPCRYLHCSVQSAGVYYDSIPSDLYYSAMDGTFDANGNNKYGEIADSADLLPELSVGRFPVNDTSELRKMIRKTVAYQINPVTGEFSKPLLTGEYLYGDPVTFGSDYMNLLIGDHNDNGYFTHGIPPEANQIGTLYDSLVPPQNNIWQWSSGLLLNRLNQGTSFIHHTGHANISSMMRLYTSGITNANFPQVNGINHNFQLLYTHGCNCGAFDNACIAAKAVKIDNFLVAGIFNSRYGWFNQGTTDGPSQHLHREFVGSLYHDTVPERRLGMAHARSKVLTAPWVGLPGEFEPGAQRWCHFGCNVFGDPALNIWTAEPDSFYEFTWTGAIDSDWQKPGNWNHGIVPGSVCNVTIAAGLHQPVINTTTLCICRNLTISSGANLTILPGYSLTVLGTVNMSTD